MYETWRADFGPRVVVPPGGYCQMFNHKWSLFLADWPECTTQPALHAD